MKRNLIAQGANSYTVTLPKRWIEQQKLQAGSEVDVSIVDNKVIIRGALNKEQKEIAEINTKDDTIKTARTKISANYRQGKNHLIIRGIENKSKLEFQRMLHSFEGIEFVKETSDSIEVILQLPNGDIKNVTTRLFQMVLMMLDETMQETQSAKELNQFLKQEVMKLRDKGLRLIESAKYMEQSLMYHEIITTLEKIGYCVVQLQQFKESKKIPVKEMEDISLYLRKLYTLFLQDTKKKNSTLAQEIQTNARKVITQSVKGDQPQLVVLYPFWLHYTTLASRILALQ